MNTLVSPPSKQRIHELLDDLPPEGLVADQPVPLRYRTISLSLAALSGLVGMMPPLGGDALAETEALYDRKG